MGISSATAGLSSPPGTESTSACGAGGEDEGTVIRLEPGAEATVYWEEAEAGDYTRVYGILFNQSVPLFSSEAVRQALAADLPESVSRPETALSPGLREGLGTVKLPELAIDAALYRSGSAGNEAEGLTVLIPEDEALSRLFSDVAQLWQRDFGLYLAVETLPEAELMERVEAGITTARSFPSRRTSPVPAGRWRRPPPSGGAGMKLYTPFCPKPGRMTVKRISFTPRRNSSSLIPARLSP